MVDVIMISALHQQTLRWARLGSLAARLGSTRCSLLAISFSWLGSLRSAPVLHLALLHAVFGLVQAILGRFGAVFDWFKVFGLCLKLFEGFETSFGALEALFG